MTVREVLGLVVLVAFLVAYGGGFWLGLRLTKGIKLALPSRAGAVSKRAMPVFTWSTRIFVALIVAEILSLPLWLVALMMDRLP
jgi:heme/copper-type cytochrome/quinol oxidase subunit 1